MQLFPNCTRIHVIININNIFFFPFSTMMVMSVTFALHFHGTKTSWERCMVVIFEPKYNYLLWTTCLEGIVSLVSWEGVTVLFNPWCTLLADMYISGCTCVALASWLLVLWPFICAWGDKSETEYLLPFFYYQSCKNLHQSTYKLYIVSMYWKQREGHSSQCVSELAKLICKILICACMWNMLYYRVCPPSHF